MRCGHPFCFLSHRIKAEEVWSLLNSREKARACPELAEGVGAWEEGPFISPVTNI